MKTSSVGNDIITTFSSDEEKETIFKLIKNHIASLPKVRRKIYKNWVFVRDLTFNGRGYSESICRALDVEPDGFIWEKQCKKEVICNE